MNHMMGSGGTRRVGQYFITRTGSWGYNKCRHRHSHSAQVVTDKFTVIKLDSSHQRLKFYSRLDSVSSSMMYLYSNYHIVASDH